LGTSIKLRTPIFEFLNFQQVFNSLDRNEAVVIYKTICQEEKLA
jgi:hypothetical protein